MQTVVFNENTISILKNFSNINQSILIKPGNVLSTISPSKNIIAYSTIDQTFENTFGIYDLSQFLSALSLFKEPSLNIYEKYLEIQGNNTKLTYSFCDPSLILVPPSGKLNFPKPEIHVDLKDQQLQNVLKAASVLGLPDIAFVGDGNTIFLKAMNAKSNMTSQGDVYSMELGSTNKIFSAVIKVENFKFIPDDYEVSISSKGISNFKGKKADYYVVVESTLSNFN